MRFDVFSVFFLLYSRSFYDLTFNDNLTIFQCYSHNNASKQNEQVMYIFDVNIKMKMSNS